MRFELWIDKAGRVISVRDMDQQPDIDAFVMVLRAAKFKPATLDGVECEAMTVFTLDIPDMPRGKPLNRS